MPDYRRYRIEGSCHFLTLVTHGPGAVTAEFSGHVLSVNGGGIAANGKGRSV